MSKQGKLIAAISSLFQRSWRKLVHPARNFRDIIENAPDAVIQGDTLGNVISVNKKAIEITGYSKEEMLRMNFSSFFNTVTLKDKPLRYDLLNEGKIVQMERELRTKSGQLIQVETNSRALDSGTFITFLRDITERKIAEKEVWVSEARLRRAELASKAGNWELHLDSRIMIGSHGACKIYGVEVGQLDFEVVKNVPLHEYRQKMDLALTNLIQNNIPYDIEFKIKAVDTQEIKDIHSIAIYDAEKKILFGIIQDITEQKKVEEEFKKAKEKAEESDRLKTAFLHNLSHEIRTPMNSIIGFAELLSESLEDKDKLKEYSDIINLRCNDLLNIINDILEIAKIETNQVSVNLTECNIQNLLSEIKVLGTEYRNRLNKSQIQFKVNCNPNLPDIILTDQGKLKQILINLVTNAFKFTQQGEVLIDCSSENDRWISFKISDTGYGIPQDKLDEVFERFVKLQPDKTELTDGNGLGLSIVRGLLEVLDGTIHLKSELGKGSTFTFQIPLNIIPKQKTSGFKEENKYSAKLGNKTVLIVEDDIYNAEYLKQLLRYYGVKILHAYNCKEALEITSENLIDLVLMDIHLPDGNGYDITRKIRESDTKLVIIAHTAYVSQDEKEKALNAGCNDFLSKPTHKEDILRVLNQQIKE